MSIIGLLDSRINVYRLGQATTDSMGDVDTVPTPLIDNIKAAVSSMYRMRIRDTGAGEYPEGFMTLFYHKRYDIRLADVIYVSKGPMIGSWWIVQFPTQITRAVHREAGIVPYEGKTPDLG